MAAILPIVGLIGSIASAGLGAIGAMKQADAQAQAAEYNAKVKENQARAALDQSSAQTSNDAVKTRQKVAATRAASIQNGFENSGSVTDVLRVVQTQGELEGLTAMYDGTVRANALRDGAELDKMSASNARTAGFINAGTSLLSGASKLYTGGSTSL